MLQIVVPMAGAGSRFARVGHSLPKPLIDVGGQPMISRVIDNLRPARAHRFVFVCQRAHDATYGLSDKLGRWAPGCAIVHLDGLTDGAARTVLAAAPALDAEAPMMIANSDQFVDFPIDTYLAESDRPGLHGLIMTMVATDPKWSFASCDEAGFVTRVAEKEPISDEATVGVYNFARAGDFVTGAQRMIAADRRVNGEFYVAPVYNELIETGARLRCFNIERAGGAMHGLGTPEDLSLFLAGPASALFGVAA